MIIITPEQQKLASDNHNLIYDFLLKHKLSIEEYYDIAAIGLCKAAKSYKKDKSKFSTYAFYVMNNEVKMNYRLTTRMKDIPRESLVYYQDRIGSTDDDERDVNIQLNSIKSRQNTETEAILNIIIEQHTSKLSGKCKKIVALACLGYKQREIARELGISQSYISRVLKKFKRDIKLH